MVLARNDGGVGVYRLSLDVFLLLCHLCAVGRLTLELLPFHVQFAYLFARLFRLMSPCSSLQLFDS